MRKRITAMLLTGGAAALTVALSATTALAATSLTVKVTGGATFTATASGNTVLTDGNVSVTCTSSSASSTIKSGTYKGTAPVKIGTATNLKFGGCTGPLGAVTTTPKKEPYNVSANSVTKSGETDAAIGPVDVAVSMTDCSFTVGGSAPGYYNNSKHTLTMTPTLPVAAATKQQLTISNVVNCLGTVHNGDHPTYKATYNLKPATLSISSS